MADEWLGRLYAAEAANLLRLARFFVDDRAAAEDLVQEAFIRLSGSRERLREPAASAAYLRAIVLNLARDHNRRGLMSFRHRPPADTGETSIEDQVVGREEARAVVSALRELPRRQRDCIVLRYYLELPVTEVAATLGLSTNSVKTHLQRGLRALEVRLAGRRSLTPGDELARPAGAVARRSAQEVGR
jgi:RNA polymerase sigma-70 factor (sigma-E family)